MEQARKSDVVVEAAEIRSMDWDDTYQLVDCVCQSEEVFFDGKMEHVSVFDIDGYYSHHPLSASPLFPRKENCVFTSHGISNLVNSDKLLVREPMS